MDALGWLIFLVALLLSVMLHEAGHFVMAKKFGMKATSFFVGFGPTVWSTWRGETEYGIKALPLGGFVKIVGMTSMDDVNPEDEPRSFRRAPGWQRLIVLAAGRCASALAEPETTWAYPVPTYRAAAIGFCFWKTIAGAMPK